MGEVIAARKEIYKDVNAERTLLDLFESDGNYKPEFDLEHGYRYPRAEKLLDKGPEETREFLEQLSDAGLLEREHHDREIRCPSCGSPNTTSTYVCPHCGSMDIDSDQLIEHLACGNIDSISSFREGDELVCLQCKATVTPGSYRVVGSRTQCRSCGKQLEVLSVRHRCRRCGEAFDYERARFNDAFKYSLSEEAKREISRGIFYTSQLRTILEESGFSSKEHRVLEGRSGMEYEFDVVASAPAGRELTVDVDFSSEPMSRERLMEEYGKIADAERESYFIVTPPLRPELKKLADSLGVNIVQAERPSEALQLFSQLLPKTSVSSENAAEDVTKTTSGEETREPEPAKPVRRMSIIIAAVTVVISLFILFYVLNLKDIF